MFYPFEIGFTDNLDELFNGAVKGGSYETQMRCYLKGAGKERLIAAVTKPKKNAAVSFGKNGFTYEKEENGVGVDEKKLSAALEKMMKNKQHISLVTEGNKITGILTLEDIFEEMVGEIEDEYDFSPAYIRPFGAGVLASAGAKMSDVLQRLDLPLPADLSGTVTVEQWVNKKLDHMPTKNEKIRDGALLLETRKFRRHKLMEAFICKV